jgi:hypothetical protein
MNLNLSRLADASEAAKTIPMRTIVDEAQQDDKPASQTCLEMLSRDDGFLQVNRCTWPVLEASLRSRRNPMTAVPSAR